MVELVHFYQSLLDTWMPKSEWAQTLFGLCVLVVVALLAQVVIAHVVLRIIRRLLHVSGRENWDEALRRRGAYRNLWRSVPPLVVSVNADVVPHFERMAGPVSRLALILAIVFFFQALRNFLSALQDTYAATTRAQTRSIKGYIELGKIALLAICFVLVISILVNRSPVILISGLGALSAVLLLVFKDTLLSLVASTQLTSNDMLRIGDWIEMPQAGADGFVIDIALHTVKVQNWDKTVTTIPTYKLFSESYRNWRQMFESGGRRIKRTLRINASSVRFLSDEEHHRFQSFNLLKDYLKEKDKEISRFNEQLEEGSGNAVNRRRLTNLGTFRAYAKAYIQANKEIRKDMLLLVRMMEPTAEGIPVEVYCFTNNTAWVEYERIQGDIFDHLLAILPEFDLQLYQAPSGADLLQLGPREAARAAAMAASNRGTP
ncbi:mechanosensitive ion channel family protein [Kerstersia gyiorum]|jgi:miniconductance mechanosensitive channel|uniref:mechanosensitive ion channel family protein n=1 Tax=Kerstersia gyiorum TaxID=206506 RepID=UPI00209D9A4A|nr:mechanosensitive ion channel domain-containing protein [Kerstersia gyiorum]MCP1634704.1 miniconductance mechanosensitive channel [Kerstersia gyiorum]MCP1635933.1 miniconductance mechanosensitive channel [Kerstersia gyiorum]MCP1672594.1 miniconductance mechanosensitive channel [Kerstersia gyiorum]MCP1680575.1 miniconductance mechanosensitive channel [Kerstersia gyiorum]MCP1683886.1 miniconductance mechanosensitive channel [Kerstersia gyiorum]